MGVAGQDEDLDEVQTHDVATETQQDPQDPPRGDPQVDPDAVDEDEDVVQIGDEDPPASEEQQTAPKWVKDLRDRQRQLARENAELKAKLGSGQPVPQAAPQLPEFPKLADHDYDEDKFQAAVKDWHAKEREIEAFRANQTKAEEERKKAVQAVHESYATSKKALKVRDFQDAEDEVKAQFSEVQQSIVIAGAANPGALVYALGKTPKKLQELASIKDPVKFAVAIGKLETEVKVTKRTSTKPAPEQPLRSTTTAKASTATLDRLEAEAARTGDRSKVIAYKRSLNAPGK